LKRTRAKQKFEEMLRESVDEGLSSLGGSAKQAIYYYLEKGFNLNKQEIPNKVKDFATAIEKFFGVGANFLEALILKQLYEKVGESFNWDGSGDLNFSECVALARQSIEPEQLKVEI